MNIEDTHRIATSNVSRMKDSYKFWRPMTAIAIVVCVFAVNTMAMDVYMLLHKSTWWAGTIIGILHSPMAIGSIFLVWWTIRRLCLIRMGIRSSVNILKCSQYTTALEHYTDQANTALRQLEHHNLPRIPRIFR